MFAGNHQRLDRYGWSRSMDFFFTQDNFQSATRLGSLKQIVSPAKEKSQARISIVVSKRNSWEKLHQCGSVQICWLAQTSASFLSKNEIHQQISAQMPHIHSTHLQLAGCCPAKITRSRFFLLWWIKSLENDIQLPPGGVVKLMLPKDVCMEFCIN